MRSQNTVKRVRGLQKFGEWVCTTTKVVRGLQLGLWRVRFDYLKACRRLAEVRMVRCGYREAYRRLADFRECVFTTAKHVVGL